MRRRPRAPAAAPPVGSSPRCRSACSTTTARDITDRACPATRCARGRRRASATSTTTQANDELFTTDGWMLIGDVVEIDADGYLRVVGRTSDFIIRGGKNISAARGRGRGRDAPRRSRSPPPWPCPTRSSANGCASTPSSHPDATLELDDARRAPRRRGRRRRSGSPNGSSCSTSSPAPPAARSPRASSGPGTATRTNRRQQTGYSPLC